MGFNEWKAEDYYSGGHFVCGRLCDGRSQQQLTHFIACQKWAILSAGQSSATAANERETR
jgi:hypothetical protein